MQLQSSATQIKANWVYILCPKPNSLICVNLTVFCINTAQVTALPLCC
jgi:hypothetical protein